MAIGVGVAIGKGSKEAAKVEAVAPTNWYQCSDVTDFEAGDRIIIATNDQSNYFNGATKSGPHWDATTLNASNPASTSADGVIILVETGTANRYKLKLAGGTNKDKYVTATKAGSKGSAIAASDSNGWTFTKNATNYFELNYEGNNAKFCSYSDSDFRSYASYSAGQYVTIFKYSSKTISGIAVKTAPQSIYNAGDYFDPTGLVITATYSDSTTSDVLYAPESGFTFSPSLTTALETSDDSVTITYGGQSTSLGITVYEKTVSAIAVKTNPNKTAYHTSDAFDATGLSITVTYISGLTEDLTTGFTVSPSPYTFTSDDETAGSKTFTVTYGGKTTTFDVIVAGIIGPIPSGRYYLMDSTKENGINAAAATSGSPSAVDLTATNELTAFDVELVADNEYEISVTISSTKYYLVCNTTATSSSNTSIRITNSPLGGLKTKYWNLDSDGVGTSGAYHLKENTVGDTYRYLACYNGSDWRGYVNTSNGDPEINFVPENSLAGEIASAIMSEKVGEVLCNNGASAPNVSRWNTIAGITKIEHELAILRGTTAAAKDGEGLTPSGTLNEKAMARYDQIITTYNTKSVETYVDFLGRVEAQGLVLKTTSINVVGNDNRANYSTTLIIVAISSLTVLSVGGYFFIRKRKEQN